MKLKEIQLISKKLLDATHKLVVGPNKRKSLFSVVLEGVFRRDYITLGTIFYLSNAKPEARGMFGDCCMDLARRVLEDAVSLRYMLLKGKGKMAKKFADFKAIEVKKDLDYLGSVGIKIDKKLDISSQKKYKAVEKKFRNRSNYKVYKSWEELTFILKEWGVVKEGIEKKIKREFKKKYGDKKGGIRKSWAGLDIESMIIELRNNKDISDREAKSLMQTYQVGNYKNHFSSTDVFNFLYQDLFDFSNKRNLLLSLVSTTSLVSFEAVLFTKEFNVPSATKKTINQIWDIMLKAHLPKNKSHFLVK